MVKTLEEAKTFVREEYLGRAGIHGVGLRRAENAVLVYIHEESPEQEVLVEQIRQEVSPFDLHTVREAQPVIR